MPSFHRIWKLFFARYKVSFSYYVLFFLADVELELYIKINNGGPMVLSVKPSNSIEMIKTQIESLNNIPVKDQILTLNGEKLKNEDKLSRFQIENCIIQFTHRP